MDESDRLRRRATAAAVLVAGGLGATKFAAWLATGSVAVLASTIDSVLDLGASAVAFVAVRHAVVPPDDDHGFGHGKAEPLGALLQAGLLVASAVFVVMHSVPRLRDPPAIEQPAIGVAVMVLGLVVTLALLLYQHSVARRTGSLAIRADAVHYTGDVLAHGALAVGLLLAARPGMRWVDGALGLLVAVYMAHAAWRVARESIDALMDHELPEPDRERALEAAAAHPSVVEVCGVRTRSSGTRRFVELRVSLPADMPLEMVHEVRLAIAEKVAHALPDAEVEVHAAPAKVTTS